MNLDTSDVDTLIINFGSENYLHNEKLRKSSDGLPPTLKESYEAAQGASDECVEMTQEMLSYMEHVIQDGVLSDWKIFEGMEFRNEAYPESKDMFVLVNIFNA